MPAETRRKISAALKGRRKSPEHRESLRRRFEGSQNPMYGRKLSAESRAKISRAMAAKGKQKKQDNVDKPEQANSPAKRKNKQLMEQTLDQLREKAVQSKLITSATQPPPKRKPNRILHDDLEAAHLDKILKRVASLDEPPEAVVRTLQNNRKRREKNTLERRAANNRGRAASGPPSTGLSEKSDKKALPEPDKTVDASERNCQCTVCNGTGLMQCPNCVGTFGVSSSRCDLCFGAGGVFCDTCQGVGSVIT
ncbi:hypothetical protein BWQ96_09696 [Gracilariopsis chorda]|uniref:Nuclease associated modular domain-containing protein n=1 Tax=Gracilariopsis chorda TaxID=448386 RepID=A0A2V3IEW3_9FLOR|nr:hypothetical protein BWQ96_09696 [Gracilariopsis chorda]|eukprot:PXF40592.1 hypothetical protein BWQ96_09696 [Gracilariopsis chorda]